MKKGTKPEISIFKKLVASFDNSTYGFSARKLSAFVAVAISVYATMHYVDGTTVVSTLKVWLLFALLCLGIITAEQLIKIRNRGTSESESKEEETEQTQEESPEEEIK